MNIAAHRGHQIAAVSRERSSSREIRIATKDDISKFGSSIAKRSNIPNRKSFSEKGQSIMAIGEHIIGWRLRPGKIGDNSGREIVAF